MFETTSSEYSPIPPKEPTPPRDTSKGKDVATEEPKNKLVAYIEEGWSNLKMPKMTTFITPEGTLFQEDFTAQLREMKRLAELKEQEKKSDEELRRLLNLTNPLRITKISYIVDSYKIATMRISKGDDPLNLIVYLNFRLKMLSFNEWLEVHALASKKTRKSIDLLLQILKAKFQWVLNQAKKVGLPPPPELATF
ncbi:hypothetical protein Tco_1165006 [Tanacetum coccineum]